jgi:acyl-CoA reductase-like NAD-dependent aldehyde dehydrogenase
MSESGEVGVDWARFPKLTQPRRPPPRRRHVNFTGSTRVGSIIASLAGKYLKPTLMELGGKAPVVVLSDADMVKAANASKF